MFGNNILPTSGPKEVDPIIIANIQRQSQDREYEIVEDSIGSVKLKNYTSEDSALSKEVGLFQYYCALCGAHLLVSNANLAEVSRRRTDQALILGKNLRFCRYMKKGKKVAIRREGGLEVQWRWTCVDCGVETAYQCVSHETGFSNEITNKSAGSYSGNLYIISKALATDASYCELLEEVQKIVNKNKRDS